MKVCNDAGYLLLLMPDEVGKRLCDEVFQLQEGGTADCDDEGQLPGRRTAQSNGAPGLSPYQQGSPKDDDQDRNLIGQDAIHIVPDHNDSAKQNLHRRVDALAAGQRDRSVRRKRSRWTPSKHDLAEMVRVA